jgi:hypothetical protein
MMKREKIDVKAGDRLKGRGGLGVNVRVVSIDGDTAHCVLERSGNPKDIKIATLRSAYDLVERRPEGA